MRSGSDEMRSEGGGSGGRPDGRRCSSAPSLLDIGDFLGLAVSPVTVTSIRPRASGKGENPYRGTTMTLLPGLVAVGSLLGLTLPDREPPTGTPAASLSFFTDRAGFLSQFPALALEDFEQGSAPFGGLRNCPGPLDATSDNTCVSPGAIKPGARF